MQKYPLTLEIIKFYDYTEQEKSAVLSDFHEEGDYIHPLAPQSMDVIEITSTVYDFGSEPVRLPELKSEYVIAEMITAQYLTMVKNNAPIAEFDKFFDDLFKLKPIEVWDGTDY